VTTLAVVVADIAGAVIGASWEQKPSRAIEVTIAAAIGGAIFASSTVGSGQPSADGISVHH